MEENSKSNPDGKKHHSGDSGDDGQPKCSGKSCTAGVIADCVALCCCPCALLNLFTLAFVKVPYKITKKCLGKAKNKKKKKKIKEVETQSSGKIEWMDDNNENNNNICGKFEEENIWLELYQNGHLGFGRLSFNDLPSLGKEN